MCLLVTVFFLNLLLESISIVEYLSHFHVIDVTESHVVAFLTTPGMVSFWKHNCLILSSVLKELLVSFRGMHAYLMGIHPFMTLCTHLYCVFS